MLKSLALFIAILVTSSAAAQHTQPQYEHINVENGLPNAHVTKSLEDQYGYIWIGTENGLVRYDGYNKKVYKLETEKPQSLSSLNIQELFQDSKGNIWVGTFYDGFFRYNRATDNFTQFKNQPGNPNSIAANDVHSIREDGFGNLFIYTYDHPHEMGFLNQFNIATGKVQRFGPTLRGRQHIPNLDVFLNWYKDPAGRLWIASKNGLYTFDYKAGKLAGLFSSADSTKQKNISKLYQLPSDPHLLYFADLTSQKVLRGIAKFDSRTRSLKTYPYTGPKAGGSVTVYCFFEDKKKRLWMGTSRGLSRFDTNSQQFVHYDLHGVFTGMKATDLYTITDDNTGLLWLSTNSGLMNFDPATRQYSNRTDIFQDEINPDRVYSFQSAFQDRSGSLWLKDREGLHRLRKEFSLFNHYKKDGNDPASYQGGFLYNMAQTGDGNYLLAGIRGLNFWNPKTDSFRKLTLPPVITATDIVLNLSIDHSGDLWGAATSGNYIFKSLFRYQFQNKALQFFKSIPGDSTTPSSDFVSFLYTDKQNDVWVGTYDKGLCRYNRKTNDFTRFPFIFRANAIPNGELDDLSVSCIYEDKQGTIWVGTVRGGLNRLDKSTGKFTEFYDIKKGLRQITSIYEDKKGRFWVASEVYGLHLFDRKTGTSRLFTEKDGLISNEVVGIAEDNAGNLWLSTARGLSMFNTETKTFRSFTKEQGLPDNRLTSCSVQLSDGKILLSSYTGFITFDPEKISINTVPPLVQIESVAYLRPSGGNKSKEITLSLFGRDNLELAHDENRVKFNYVGLHYKNPSRNQYMYQMEGYDNQWVQGNNMRTAIYTNLSPGAYTFKVKASNADGVWSKEEARFSFVILPPWWRTWWAYTLYIVVFALALRSYIYIRSRALRRENQLLEEKIGLRTQELSAANKELNTQRDQLTETVNELKSTQQQLIQSEKLASLGELTAGIAHEIQNPLNFVNNFSEVSVELAEEMEYELQNGEKEEAIAIAGDIKQNLQKIMHHGQRAGGIVRSMLQHSRKNAGEKELTDLNELTDEYLKLGYHGLRAKDNSFNSKITTAFDPDLPKLAIIPQDMGRVLINLFNNAFYAVQQRQKKEGDTYKPELQVSTALKDKFVEIHVRDNGTGIPDAIKDKILQPFFTTKPTGEGTGLGLSLSYDILKAHGGKMDIESKEGKYTLFTLSLPV